MGSQNNRPMRSVPILKLTSRIAAAPDIHDVPGRSYYWCVDQYEFAADINFKTREELSRFYKTLVETVYFTFSRQDIYSFFGRNVEKSHTFRKGEIEVTINNPRDLKVLETTQKPQGGDMV